ncbi:MAG: helix-turn-helix domain-containing protein [Solirubrobacteraceae bacterium]
MTANGESYFVEAAALVSGPAAWVLGQVLPGRDALAARLDEAHVAEEIREAALGQLAAITRAGRAWAATQRADSRGQQRTPADIVPCAASPAGSIAPGCESEYLTTKEFAGRLNISERTVRRRIAAGELPVAQLGRTIRVHRDALTPR